MIELHAADPPIGVCVYGPDAKARLGVMNSPLLIPWIIAADDIGWVRGQTMWNDDASVRTLAAGYAVDAETREITWPE